MNVQVSEAALVELVSKVLQHAGVIASTAQAVALTVAAAERDGAHSHGLIRLEGYLGSIASGWVDGQAIVTVRDQAPSVVHADAANGFAQGALHAARSMLISKARSQGVASLVISNSHHFGCLWPDVEPFAESGLVAMCFVNSRSRMVAPGARRKVLGTNPMAFAAPRTNLPPLVWDQASSVMAHGDVIIAAKTGARLPPNAGVDREGNATDDPAAVLDDGALLPFASHKGLLIALLVEILAAGLTGGRFGYEDESGSFPGAQTSNAGQLVIALDPVRMGASHFGERIDELLSVLTQAGTARLPGQRRYEQREVSRRDGIQLAQERYQELLRMAGSS
ncbi:lactate dehydrogenase [Variovorax sp. WS11]|uniref:Ldh family oxidoreductase n=1 Tax=Variovorax sp. WS11 TaxID=1105204 RepID=UPI000D0DD8FA|nr:Ldh family oxidoreductase [Variovorax sp. WS11]NDZ18325.1 Ldh family oxidoreductase [Variovorax sp. WS11]PSL84322.1 lactate dehydrogenase [Variovorax sp. WS11]